MSRTRRLADLAVAYGPELVVVAAVIVQIWIMAPLFGRGEPLGDDLSIHLSEIAFLERAMRAGDFEWWSPYANLGYPVGMYYQVLPQLIPAVAALIFGDAVSLLTLYKISIALPIVLLPVTSFWALRVVGLRRPEAAGGALAVGLVFASSAWGLGIDSVFSMGLYTQPWATLFFPLAVAWCARWLIRGEGLGRAVGWSLVTGLCHPFIGFALGPAVLMLPWWLGGRAQLVAAVKRLAALGALVLAAAAFFWLPILVYYDSFGGFPSRRLTERGIPPGSFVSMVFGGELLDYTRLPVLTLLLFPAGIMAALRRGPLLYLFAVAAFFASLVAFLAGAGQLGRDLVPPVRFLLGAQLGLALAAGAGGVAALREGWRRTHRMKPGAGASVRVALAALAAVAAGLLVYGGHERSTAKVRVVSAFPRILRDEMTPLLDKLAVLPSGRVFADKKIGTGSHWWMYLPSAWADQPALRAFGGACLQSSASFDFMRFLDVSEQYDLYNVRYALARARAVPPKGKRPAWEALWPDSKLIAGTEHHVLVEVPGGGYFRPVEVTGSIPASRSARLEPTMAWVRAYRHGQRSRLEIGPARGLVGPGGRAEVEKEWQQMATYGATVNVDGAQPATVALSVTYHPAWHATIDGAAAVVRRVTPDMMAVDVPPGRHDVVLRFHRPRWIFAAMLGTLCLLAGLVVRARRLRASPSSLLPSATAQPVDTHERPSHSGRDADRSPNRSEEPRVQGRDDARGRQDPGRSRSPGNRPAGRRPRKRDR